MHINRFLDKMAVMDSKQNKDVEPNLSATEGGTFMLSVTSSTFTAGKPMPLKTSTWGDNTSPHLKWSGAPANTKTFAIIADDPDAPDPKAPRMVWVHWVVWNIPASVTELAEGQPKTEKLANGAVQGKNDSKKSGYDGPTPPIGTHRYFFKVYALDCELVLKSGATKPDLLNAMKGHVLAEGQIIGLYSAR